VNNEHLLIVKRKVQNPFKFVMLQNAVYKGEGRDMK